MAASWPAATLQLAVSLDPLVPVEVEAQLAEAPPWPVIVHVGVPVGVAPEVEPGAAAEMVALKVTASPLVAGFWLEVMAKAGLALLIVSLSGLAAVPAVKFESPAYEALTESGDWEGLRPERMHVALPDAMTTVSEPWHTGVAPGVVKPKVTRPVGVPAPGAAAESVSVTMNCWPVTAGFAVEVKAWAAASFEMVTLLVPDEALKLESEL